MEWPHNVRAFSVDYSILFLGGLVEDCEVQLQVNDKEEWRFNSSNCQIVLLHLKL